MIAIDTNVLVRLMTGDDESQFQRAARLVTGTQEKVFLSDVVLVETWWVLKNGFKLQKQSILEAFRAYVDHSRFTFQSLDVVKSALNSAASGSDFADALIHLTANQAGCSGTYTFDVQAARKAGMTLLD